MSKSTLIATSLSVLMLLVGCESVSTNIEDNMPETLSAQSSNSNLSQRTIEGWKAHVTQVKSEGELQKGCEPFYKLAKGKSKGSVMLFHGYSACPQQYEELSSLLSTKGFNVFVPLIPGHGREPKVVDGKFVDQSQNLPDVKNTVIYENFSKNMGSLLKDEQGTKIVGGLSVGGAIAAKAMITNPEIYSRGFLMAPFFNAAGPISVLLPALGAIIPNKAHSWGSDCEVERKFGRAGYCNFKLTNIAAVRKFGLDTLKDVSKIQKPVQIVGVEKDPAASNSAIAEAVNKLPNGQACFLAKGAEHSMLSPQDNVDVDMFWLEPLKQQLTQFVDTGRGFDVVGKSEQSLGLCRSRL
jgi:alpha-beta hydrolase superfamily lysophospholipase